MAKLKKELPVTLFVKDAYDNEGSVQVNYQLVVNDNEGPIISGVNLSANPVIANTSVDRVATLTVSYTVNDAAQNVHVNDVDIIVHPDQTLPQGVTIPTKGTIKNGNSCTTTMKIKSENMHDDERTVPLQIVASDPDNNKSTHDFSVKVKVKDNGKPTVTVQEPNKNRNIVLSNLPDGSQTSGSVSATFLIQDDMTPSEQLTINTFGATMTGSHGTRTLTKTFNYNSSLGDFQNDDEEIKIKVTDGANNFKEEKVSFTVVQTTHDLVEPLITNVKVRDNNDLVLPNNEVIMSTSEKAAKTFQITANISDPSGQGSKGINWNSVLLTGDSSGTYNPFSYDVTTGDVVFKVTWQYNDNRWKNKFTPDYPTAHSEVFTIRASDLETTPQANTSTSTTTVKLKRIDNTPPNVQITSIKINNSNVSASNPIQINSQGETTEEVEINFNALDAANTLMNNTFQLTLAQTSGSESIVYSTGTGLTVSPINGANYQTKMKLTSSQTKNLVDMFPTIEPYIQDVNITVSVNDKAGNTGSDNQIVKIQRVDPTDPIIGDIESDQGFDLQVTGSQTSVVHVIKVTATDQESGISNIVANAESGYVAASPSYNNGYYLFTRTYTYDEVWQNKHNSLKNINGIKITATNGASRSAESNPVDVTVTALDTEDPSIITAFTREPGTGGLTEKTIIAINTGSQSSVGLEFVVVVDDNDFDTDALTVYVTNDDSTPKRLDLTKGITSDERRTFKGTRLFDSDFYEIGTTTETWTAYAVDSNGNQHTKVLHTLTIINSDITDPIIEDIKIFNNLSQEVTSATLNIGTGSGFSGEIIATVTDRHSEVPQSANIFTFSTPNALTIGTITSSTSNGKKQFKAPIVFNATSAYNAYNQNGGPHNNEKFTVTIKDTYNNDTDKPKPFPITILDTEPPQITNINADQLVFEYDKPGDPPTPTSKSMNISADVTDNGSGVKSVSAVVSYGTRTESVTLTNSDSKTYSGSVTIDPSNLQYGDNFYTVKVTAVPNLGHSNDESLIGNKFTLNDTTGPVLSNVVVKDTQPVTIGTDDVVNINSADGSVTLKYIVNGNDSHTPLSVVKVTSDILPNGHIVKNATGDSSQVSFQIDYSAQEVLELRKDTEGDYGVEKNPQGYNYNF